MFERHSAPHIASLTSTLARFRRETGASDVGVDDTLHRLLHGPGNCLLEDTAAVESRFEVDRKGKSLLFRQKPRAFHQWTYCGAHAGMNLSGSPQYAQATTG